jgi:hypothetical protein
MHISVHSLTALDDNRVRVSFSFDGRPFDGTVVLQSDDGAEMFNMEERFWSRLFMYDGLGANFSRDFWKYRAGEPRALPWDYGDFDLATIREVAAHTRTNLDFLGP